MRRLDVLQPAFRQLLELAVSGCAERGVEMLVYYTHRIHEEQAHLFAQGRSSAEIEDKAAELATRWGRPDLAAILLATEPQPGNVVTDAGPGQSLHYYGLAADAVPLVGGLTVWSDKGLWTVWCDTAEACGLLSGRSWDDKPHVQMPGYDWRQLITQMPPRDCNP